MSKISLKTKEMEKRPKSVKRISIEMKNQKERERKRELRASLTAEEREEFRRKNAEASRLRRANLSKEEIALRRKKDAERKRELRAKLPDERLFLRRKEDTERQRERRSKLTEEQLILRSKENALMGKERRTQLYQEAVGIESKDQGDPQPEQRCNLTEKKTSLQRKEHSQWEEECTLLSSGEDNGSDTEYRFSRKRKAKKSKEIAPISNDDILLKIKRMKITVIALKKAGLELIKNCVASKLGVLNGGKGLAKNPVAQGRNQRKEIDRKVHKHRRPDINQHKEKYPIIVIRENRLICIVCNEECDTRFGIRQHLSCHLQSELTKAKETCVPIITEGALKSKTQFVLLTCYTCEVCSVKCYSLAIYRNHIIDKHKDNKELVKKMCFPCSFCDVAFVVKKAFTAHQRDLHNIFAQCPVCRENFETQESFANHVNETHSDCDKNNEMVFEYEEGYFCKDCGVCSRSYGYVFTHCSNVHSENQSLRCEHCNVTFNSRMSFVRHQRKYHEEKLYCCEVCGERFSNSSILKFHRRKHTIPKPTPDQQAEERVECTECGKILANKESLRHHNMAKHQLVKFECPVCKKSFKYRSLLYRHRITVCEKEKSIPRPCLICGKMFDNYITLSYHRNNIHKFGNTEENVCHVCNITFKTPISLFKHNRKQHETNGRRMVNQKYSCAVCGKNLTDKRKLLAHWRLHREEEAFQCSICEIKFKCKMNFFRHRDIAHEIDHLQGNVKLLTDSEVDDRLIADFNEAHAAQFTKVVDTNPIMKPVTEAPTNVDSDEVNHLSFIEAIRNFADLEVEIDAAERNNTINNYIDFSRANVPVISEIRLETEEQAEDNCESLVGSEAITDKNATEHLNTGQETQMVDDQFIESADVVFEQMECPSPNECSDIDMDVLDLVEDIKPLLCRPDDVFKDPFTKQLIVKIERLFECCICNEVFPSSVIYKNHLGTKGHRLAMRSKNRDLMLNKKEKINSEKKNLRKAKKVTDKKNLRKSKNSTDKKKLQSVRLKKIEDDDGEELLPCPYCDEKFTSVYYYSKHTAEHRRRENLVCVVCPEVFGTVRKLVNHYISDHNGENILKCEICELGFLDTISLRAHMTYQHGHLKKKRSEHEKPFMCDMCGEKIRGVKPFKKHILSHGDEIHKCVHCTEEFKILTEFENHYKDVHNGEMPFPCGDCIQKFATEVRLQMHKKETHPTDEDVQDDSVIRFPHNKGKSQKPFFQAKEKITCSLCSETFWGKTKYKHHVIQKHNKRASCLICAEGFATVRHLVNHYVASHNGEKLIKCEICDMPFLDYQLRNLREHLALKHDQVRDKNCKPPTTFTCDVCGVAIKGKVPFRKHVTSHKNEKQKCVHCDEEIQGVIELESHYNETHNGEMPFPCPICSLKCSIKPRLQLHLKESHPTSNYIQDNQLDQQHKSQEESAQNYFCEFCAQFFSSEDNLTVHMREHTGDKPYRCTICDMAFTSSAILKEHANKVHKKPLHPCDICEKAFNRRKNLLRHYESYHPGGSKDPSELYCKICTEKFTKPESLKKHMKFHDPARRFVCKICSLRFLSSSNVCQHRKIMHRKTNKAANENSTV